MTHAPDLDAIDEAAAEIRSGFSSLAGRRVQVPATQPLQPYLDFMGEAYRQRIVEFDSGNGEAYCLRPDYTLALAIEIADGRLEARAGVALSPENAHAMLCGNPAMVEDTQKLLLTRGMRRHRRKEPGHVTVETYW